MTVRTRFFPPHWGVSAVKICAHRLSHSGSQSLVLFPAERYPISRQPCRGNLRGPCLSWELTSVEAKPRRCPAFQIYIVGNGNSLQCLKRCSGNAGQGTQTLMVLNLDFDIAPCTINNFGQSYFSTATGILRRPFRVVADRCLASFNSSQ
jgi:hypothetical protein